MLLSKLELQGFKSFPNSTTLHFDEGIMGVVGPNGCGKTNILDSLRWVLGEQRSSLLRGSKIEEVLFNGTSQLHPIDLAEVNLTIKNNRGVLPLEYDELVVTRRLYRSGESEYLINKSRCRLKDIVELFSDTGMGTHAYSIFQQSMVDAVLSDKADERRFLFEEAAGITKYKSRKKDALKKLENTEVDLIRLNDIISEISKNVRSLRRQASKAERLKKVKVELQQYIVIRASASVFNVEQQLRNHSTAISRLKAERTGFNAAIDTEEASVEELKLQISNLNEQITSKSSLAAEISERAIHAENNHTNIESSLKSSKQNVELWKNDIDSLQLRKSSLADEKNQTENQIKIQSDELSNLQQSLVDVEKQIDNFKIQLDESEQNLSSIKESLHKHEKNIAAERARLDAADNSINRLEEINRDIDKSLEKFRAKKQTSQEDIQQQKSRLNSCKEEISEIDDQINVNQRRQLSLVSQIEEIKKQISAKNIEKSAIEAKIEVLSKMVLEHEGYGSGVKSLFNWQGKPEGVLDTLANLITADRQYHYAIETAMNHYGQLIICQTRNDAMTCIDYLKENAAGQVSFLVLDSLASLDVGELSVALDGYIGSAAKLITTQDFLQKAVDVLFGNVAVFESGKIPHDYNGEAVDTDGTYFGRYGIVRGGKSSVTLIGRKSELSDLQDKLESVEKDLTSLQHELETNSDRLSQFKEESTKLAESKKSALAQREKINSDMTRLEFEFQESVNWLNELTANSSETGKQFELLNRQKAEIQQKIDIETDKIRDITKELELKTGWHQALLDGYEQVVGKLNQKRLKSVELSGHIHKLEDDIKRYGELVEEAQNMINRKTTMIENEQNRWLELEQEKEKIKGQLTKLFEAKDKVVEDRDELNNQKNMLSEKLNESETKLKQLRTKISSTGEDIHQEEIRFTDQENQLNNIKSNIFHEYGLRISGAKDDSYDEASISAEIERFENAVDKMGLVNMLADEEYNTEKDRLDFLEKQYKDLQDAKTTLIEVINKINKTAEEKFFETFELIKQNFQEVFQTLFDGGVAELKLTNPDDLLGTPVEIIARPGSKKLVSVNQLSGGERALTAISLLFAIYMVKPSPFCILDEIDAPLDDANVNRFVKLINKFTDNTQFIIITHNKKTMESTDLLYGVTMEQPGVSRIVSVRLNGNRVEENVQ